MYQYFIPFDGQIIFYHTMYHILFIHSSVDGHFGYFHFSFFAIMNNVAMNTHAQVFVWTYIFNNLGDIHRSEIAGSYGNCLTF